MGHKVGQLQGRSPRAALGLAGVLRALPAGCCSLLSPNLPLLEAKPLSQRSHTATSPLCSLGPSGSWEQDPSEVCQPLKHRGSLGSTRGAAPQVPVGDALGSAPCTAPTAPPWASPSSVEAPRGAAPGHTGGTGPLPGGSASSGCSPCSADTHLLWFRALMGSRAARKSCWKHLGWLPWTGTGTAPHPLPFRVSSSSHFITAGLVQGVQLWNGLSPFRH